MKRATKRERRCQGEPAARSVSLPVLAGRADGDRRTIRPSRMGRRRAAVLLGVHVLIAIHIVVWRFVGRTVSPVEPSEAMQTLENGLVNAGFVFFALAIGSTLLLGRFFCGWACHVVALQDSCTWLMKKCGVHPKPFRTRLLLWAPLVLAFYMFLWPTVRREVLQPLAGERWAYVAPWLGESGPRPGLRAEFLVEDFWETFAPWYIAIPFLAVCGFGVVYFLGSKGFCSYGCPYGAFFAPSDRLAPGRILVNENCEQCGHCTAVCTSNVRVHEEVRDFGMVVDPGCMKCLDCVSVCPNDALRFGFATPPALSRQTRQRRRQRRPGPRSDLRRRDELWVGAVFFLLFFGFRGMPLGPGPRDAVPMLMAMGLGVIGAFAAWKLVSLRRTPSVRLQNLQLKVKGRLTRAGWVFVPAAMALLAAGAWGTFVNYHRWRADVLDHQVLVPAGVVFAADYQPPEEARRIAERAIEHYRLGGPREQGGYGWTHGREGYTRLAWLNAVAGNLDEAVANLERAASLGHPAPSLEAQLSILRILREYRAGRPDGAANAAAELVALQPDDPHQWIFASEMLLRAGRNDEAAAALASAAQRWPRSGAIAFSRGLTALVRSRPLEAEGYLRAAASFEPRDPRPHQALAQLLAEMGRTAEAAAHAREAARLEAERASGPR